MKGVFMKEVYTFLEKTLCLVKEDTIVAGVSAGPDSMALLYILSDLRKKNGYKIVIAHINHNVRKESYEEAEFLKKYCDDNDIVFESMIIKKYGDDNFHNEARNIRYNFYRDLIKKYRANYLMTGHHGDDLIETILMRIVRGSTIKGYSGFSQIVDMKDYKIVRPIQMLSLFHMEQDNINAVRQAESSGYFPKEIVHANKVINLVSSIHFKDIYGINLIGQYHPTKQEYAQALDLYDEFKAYIYTYKAGDEYEMMEYFVESLGMEDLIEIINEKAVTPGMKADLSMRSDIEELGKTALTKEDVEIANGLFAQRHKDGADPAETMMMSMYMLGAMEYFDTLTPRDVLRIALEIAMVGVTGINPQNKYTIKPIPNKVFGGYELLAYYYVSWARAIPEKLNQLGLPFANAYDSAIQLYKAKYGK